MTTKFSIKKVDGFDLGYELDLDQFLVPKGYFDGVGYTANLWTWGDNAGGCLGAGTTVDRSSPGTTAGGGTTWLQISCGSISPTANYTAAIKTDGTLWTWGDNSTSGILGVGISDFSGNRSSPGTTAGGGTTWRQVSVGADSMAAVKTDGTLWTWGNNIRGQLGDGTTVDRSSPGTTAGGGTTWQQTAVGERVCTGIKTDGTLWTWGQNSSGQLGDGTVTSRSSPGTTAGGGNTWRLVSATGGYMIAIKTDGTLWTWGFNSSGALGDGTTNNRSSPGTTAGGGTTWKSAAAGYRNDTNGVFAAAVKTDGTLWTWGSNTLGQLGDGTTVDRSSPGTTAGGGTTWLQISCGFGQTAAVKTDGTLWTWGVDTYGALGDGTTNNRSSPGTTAGGGTTWQSVSCGNLFTGATTYPYAP